MPSRNRYACWGHWAGRASAQPTRGQADTALVGWGPVTERCRPNTTNIATTRSSPLRMSLEPATGDDRDVLLLAALVAAGLMSGRMFYRRQTRKDGVKERYWRNAGSWEIARLGITAAILIVGMGRG